MERQIVTVSTDGQLVIPPDVLASVHMEPGSSWELSTDDTRVILENVPESKPEGALPGSVLALRGMFAGGPSLEDALLEMRRSDTQHQNVLRPVIEDSSDIEERIAAVRGMFGSGPSLEDDLIEWRASDG